MRGGSASGSIEGLGYKQQKRWQGYQKMDGVAMVFVVERWALNGSYVFRNDKLRRNNYLCVRVVLEGIAKGRGLMRL